MTPRATRTLTAAVITAGIATWLTFGIFAIHWNNDPVIPRGVNQYGLLEPAPSPGPSPQPPCIP